MSAGSGVFGNRDLRLGKEQRRAAAQAALDAMEGRHRSATRFDESSVDFLAQEISEQMTQELARIWTAFNMGHPTLPKLAALAETIYLQWAVAALEQ